MCPATWPKPYVQAHHHKLPHRAAVPLTFCCHWGFEAFYLLPLHQKVSKDQRGTCWYRENPDIGIARSELQLCVNLNKSLTLSGLYKTSFTMFVLLVSSSSLVIPPTDRKRQVRQNQPLPLCQGSLVLLTVLFPAASTVVPRRRQSGNICGIMEKCELGGTEMLIIRGGTSYQ